jgi:fructose-1,6-bisphosphatase I
MKPEGEIYSPGGLRKKYTDGVESFVRYLEAKGSKLRYSAVSSRTSTRCS